jgi:ATP-dependent helicase/nuclease subunit A
MEGRLGPEAHDAIDEFLRLALAHERQGAPSLGAFLADIDALESSIKRDMEGAGDAVRVMTVHAAKGLESKVVFLPDTCAVPAPNLEATIFDLNRDTDLPPVLVWSPHKADDPAHVSAVRAEARRATMREYRRLLYVAMTRAEERLYIAGFYKTAKPSPDCWNSMIEQAFADTAADDAPSFWEAGTSIRRIATTGSLEPSKPLPIVREQREIGFGPDWLFRSVDAQSAIARMRPSRVGGDREAARKRKEGLVFGIALHQLLQHLPMVPDAARETSGRAFLEARHAFYPRSMHDTLLMQALATLVLPDLAPLFAPEARAELDVMGTLVGHDGGTVDVKGTVDRLRVMPDAVLVADFKSGVPDPVVPPDYRDQMALYRHVLAPLWPGRPLRMMLVWTAHPSVVELDSSVLDEAVARLIGTPGGDATAG